MSVEFADRIKQLPPYLFEEIDKAKQKAVKEGRPVIDLGVGDPDNPTPDFIVKKLQEASTDPATHKYALNKGLKALRNEMALWYKERFNVDLNEDTEILPLLGSKDGIAHIPLAFINPGDEVLIPDPGYPPYTSGTLFAGGKPCYMPLKAENKFLPDLKNIDESTAKKCKLMHLNYPNNPTGAICDKSFYAEVIDFAKKHDIIVCADAAYTEISFDGFVPPSFLELPGAKEVGVEFHSLSKTFNMTGWRVGMAVGNADVLVGLAKIKSNVDSGIFTPVQIAAMEALRNSKDIKRDFNKEYAVRRDTLVDGLNEAGWHVEKPLATFYVWAPVFGEYDSASLAKALLEKTDIIVTPGIGFGKSGEGYVRMALTVNSEKLKEVVSRIKKEFFS
ncbi:MAG: LL-diaminopimelate aminotransferase [Candidatus Omnitrophota bacterium]